MVMAYADIQKQTYTQKLKHPVYVIYFVVKMFLT